jgi:hypothetical protein
MAGRENTAALEERFMNQRTPADPPVGAKKGLASTCSQRLYVREGRPADELSQDQPHVEPKKSFFRGVAVGIAVMIPIWAWIIIRILG